MTLTDEELARIRNEVHELRAEHRDLDQVIAHLAGNPPADQLLLRRLVPHNNNEAPLLDYIDERGPTQPSRLKRRTIQSPRLGESTLA